LASFASCTEPEPQNFEPRIDGLELVYTVSHSKETVVGGLRGSVPGSADIMVRSSTGAVLVETMADEDGRFHAQLPALAHERVQIQVGAQAPVEFRVREFKSAQSGVVGSAFNGMGHIPNDLIVITEDERAYGLVVRSGDNAVSKIDLQSGLSRGVRLPDIIAPDGQVYAANPWFMKPAPDGHVFVTAFGQSRVYLLDLRNERVAQTLNVLAPVILDQAHSLARAVDINRDGVPESEVTQFVPRSPQALFVTSDQLVVAYSGFVSPRLDADRGAVYLPSVLAFWPLADLTTSPKYLVLPQLNAQEISLSHDGQLLVTCSGVIETIDGVLQTTSESSVIKIDPRSQSITEVHSLGRFGASSSVDIDGHLWTGSLLRAQVQNVKTKKVIELNQEPVDSVFRLQLMPGKLIAAPSFNSDRIHIIDAYTGELQPPPFYEPFEVGPGRPIFDGAQILARRSGRAGVDFVGPDLFCISGIASRLTPIETRKLMGP